MKRPAQPPRALRGPRSARGKRARPGPAAAPPGAASSRRRPTGPVPGRPLPLHQSAGSAADQLPSSLLAAPGLLLLSPLHMARCRARGPSARTGGPPAPAGPRAVPAVPRRCWPCRCPARRAGAARSRCLPGSRRARSSCVPSPVLQLRAHDTHTLLPAVRCRATGTAGRTR